MKGRSLGGSQRASSVLRWRLLVEGGKKGPRKVTPKKADEREKGFEQSPEPPKEKCVESVWCEARTKKRG